MWLILMWGIIAFISCIIAMEKSLFAVMGERLIKRLRV